MLTGKQRSYLKSLAHNLDPILIIGKGGVTDNTIKQLNDALEKHELIKIKILNNNMEDPKHVQERILEVLKAEFVQFIGSKFTIYRASKDGHIKLPLYRYNGRKF